MWSKRNLGRPLSQEERSLLDQAMHGTQPLTTRPRVAPPSIISPAARQKKLAQQKIFHDPPPQTTSQPSLYTDTTDSRFLRPTYSPTLLRDLRRGRWVFEDELDLHGMSSEKAKDLLWRFLASCLTRNIRCIRIIHGKGTHSLGRAPVLRGLVRQVLLQKNEVLAYCTTRPVDGGEGALAVLLINKKRPSIPNTTAL